MPAASGVAFKPCVARKHSIVPTAALRSSQIGISDTFVSKRTLRVLQAGLNPSRRLSISSPFKIHATLQSPGQQTADYLTSERSALVNRESVLFLFQLEMDAQLQRALTYEKFDLAKEIRARRQQVDEALRELQQHKGYGCGARCASNSVQVDFAPAALSLRSRLAAAVAEERYSEAAELRDELAAIEEQAAEADMPCPVTEPRFSLGQVVVHNKGYRGIICGWDLACCESPEWQAVAGVATLKNGTDQVFYHVLVDVADWPEDYEEPPVAYVAEELLDSASLADFGSPEPLATPSFQHPYSYLMFLGSDGHGNMIPSRQLRDKYCVKRKDVYNIGEEPDWDEEEEGDEDLGSGDGGGNGGGGDSGPSDSIWGGGPNLPGIDMRSLDD